MVLPKKVRIAGTEFKVRRSRGGRYMSSKELRGETDHAQCVIVVDVGGQEEQGQRSTLLHELLHALDHLNYPQGPCLSENRILALEKGLFALFNDNPGLARTIWGKNA